VTRPDKRVRQSPDEADGPSISVTQTTPGLNDRRDFACYAPRPVITRNRWKSAAFTLVLVVVLAGCTGTSVPRAAVATAVPPTAILATALPRQASAGATQVLRTPVPTAIATARPIYETRTGPKTEDVLRAELSLVGYDGPWDVASMLAAYERAGAAPQATAPTNPPTSPPIPSPPTPQGTAGTNGEARLADCLRRSLPLPNEMTLLPPSVPPFMRPRYAHEIEVQALLLSAGMLDGNSKPMEIGEAYASLVRTGLLKWTQPSPFLRVADALDDARGKTDAELSNNCGLVIIRRLIRNDSQVAAWFLTAPLYQTTGGFGFDELARALRDGAAAYAWSAEGAAYPEGVLRYLATRR
jgi:hypothetical protein